jgi:hypothetical protein
MELQTGAVKVRKDRMNNLYKVNLGSGIVFFSEPNDQLYNPFPYLFIYSYFCIVILRENEFLSLCSAPVYCFGFLCSVLSNCLYLESHIR